MLLDFSLHSYPPEVYAHHVDSAADLLKDFPIVEL